MDERPDPAEPPHADALTAGAEPDGAGLRVLYDLDNVPQTPQPMLEAVFERTVRSLKSSLRKIASDQVEVALEGISSKRWKSYMDGVPLPAIMAVAKTSWGGSLLVVLSASIVFNLVEVTLGGLLKSSAPPVEGRAFTAIETRVARRLVDAVLSDAQEAFSTVSPVTFALDHIETIPRFINIAPPSSLTVVAGISVQIGDDQNVIEILVPNATLDPIRHLLTRSTATESPETDGAWVRHLREEALRSQATLTAVLHEEMFSLHRIMNLAVGETLLFDRGVDEPVELRCDGVRLATAKVGRSGRRAAVKVVQARPGTA